MAYETTDTDRQHFCSYAQAYAAAPDDPEAPMVGGGVLHGEYLARNETTGHMIACADLTIAQGYVAASRVLIPNHVFSLRVGDTRVDDVACHPRFAQRMRNPDWQNSEWLERQSLGDAEHLAAPY